MVRGQTESGIELSIEVPSDIEDIIKLEFAKQASEKEREKLFSWLMDVLIKYPNFNMHKFLTERFGYDHTAYTRVVNNFKRWRAKLRGVSKIRKPLEDYLKFVEDMWNEARDIALDVVMGWVDKAKEMGYYNSAEKKVDMKKFIEDAVTFYIQYKYVVDQIEERYKDLEAYAMTLQELVSPQVYRLIALRLYMEFIQDVMRMQTYGIPVPPELIEEVRRMTSVFIGTTVQGEIYERGGI